MRVNRFWEMGWNKSHNTHTDEELKKILLQHKRWLETDGRHGKQADLSHAILVNVNLNEALLDRAILTEVNLHEANLHGIQLNEAKLNKADLRGAILSEANLHHADLSDADLSGANLRSANFQAANLSRAKFVMAYLEKADFQDASYTTQQFYRTRHWRNAIGIPTEKIVEKMDILDQNNLVYELKEELVQAQEEAKKGTENQEQIEELKIQLQKAEDDKKELEDKLGLGEKIKGAQKELANSLQSADDRIQENNKSAKIIGRIAIELMGLDLLIIVLFGVYVYCERFMPLFEKLGVWGLTLLSFPVIVILTIAITLLRHQKKLLDEVRHYSAEKRQIELYSGLLKASQHAAAGLNDPQKSAEYVQETFTAIRNRILSEQPHSNTAASASEKEDYGLEAIVKIIADLAAKNDVKK